MTDTELIERLLDDAKFNNEIRVIAAIRIEQLLRENARLRKANSDMGWRLNPDRMGGQFTEEEINRGNEWR